MSRQSDRDGTHGSWDTFGSPKPDFYFFINSTYFINLEKTQLLTFWLLETQ